LYLGSSNAGQDVTFRRVQQSNDAGTARGLSQSTPSCIVQLETYTGSYFLLGT
jgi:hypothetical protein